MSSILEIVKVRDARRREMPLVQGQEVDSKVKELRQTIGALNHKQVSLWSWTTLKKFFLKSILEMLKDKTGETEQKISNAEFPPAQSVQENANLRSKFAQSPDRLQRALEEKKLALEEARNAERLAKQTFHEKSALLEVYCKVQKKMSKHYTKIQAIQEQVNYVKSIEKDLKDLKAKLSDQEVLEKSLDAKLAERQSKVEQMEELKKQLEKECSIMCEEATNYLSSTKLDVESKRCTLETRLRNVEAVLSEVDVVYSKIISVKELASVKVEQLDRKCEEIVEFHNYANSISRIIKSGSEATERGELRRRRFGMLVMIMVIVAAAMIWNVGDPCVLHFCW